MYMHKQWQSESAWLSETNNISNKKFPIIFTKLEWRFF